MNRDELRQAIDRLAYTYFAKHEGEITPAQWAVFAQAAIETFVSAELKAPELEMEIAMLKERQLQIEREAQAAGRLKAQTELLELFNSTQFSDDEMLGFERAKAILTAVMP